MKVGVGDLVVYRDDKHRQYAYAGFVGEVALIHQTSNCGEYIRVKWLNRDITNYSDFNKSRFRLISKAKTNDKSA